MNWEIYLVVNVKKGKKKLLIFNCLKKLIVNFVIASFIL